MDAIRLSNWLKEKMQENNMIQADLSRASNLDTATISNYVNAKTKNPEYEQLIILANVFETDPVALFRLIGILPPENSLSPKQAEMLYLFNQMSEEEQERHIAQGRFEIGYRKKHKASRRTDAENAEAD